MSDMLVKLYALPDVTPLSADLNERGVEIRQAQPSEKRIVAEWVRQHFTESAAAECEAAIEQRPISCFIAVEKQAGGPPRAKLYDLPPEMLLGFACYDVVSRGMFGPEGVRADRRGQGIGKALLLTCLHAMKTERYAYAVIGWAGPTEFYAEAVGATLIEGSEPGIYRGPLIGKPISLNKE
ncbi:MAG: GNAT family N-acetyltransferase [candidate division NC10 bacterium]|nr:GNAT family N-acetyltransferase [candidate division NC10 bacterium]